MTSSKTPEPLFFVAGSTEVWQYPLAELPELEDLIRVNSCDTSKIEPSLQRDILGILYVERGSITIWSERDMIEVKGGNVFLIRPGETHGFLDNAFTPCKCYCVNITFPSNPASDYLGLPSGEGAEIHRQLAGLAYRSFPAPKKLARYCDTMFACLADRDNVLTLAAVRTALLSLLYDLLVAGRHVTPRQLRSKQISEAIDIMDHHLESLLSVAEIAHRVGWGRSHFNRCFREETGLTPGNFYLRRRLAIARNRIATTSDPLIEIALDLGFGTSQYLATCFKRITGRTPSCYRTR